MNSPNYSSLSDVTNLLSNRYLRTEMNDSPIEQCTENMEDADTDDSLDFDEFEEVFADHILMDERLRKTLYAGNFSGLELPQHPPIALTGLALELFSKAAPNYGLDILDMDYVSAASEAAKISPCAMILAMIYLERLQLKNSEYLETVSPPGLFVVTMLVASKFLFEDDEDVVTNQMWAEALNFDIKDLNTLEREFLSAIEWKIFVESSEYFTFLCNVEKEIAVKQSSLRNWLSYSDLYVLSQDPAFLHFWKTFLKQFVKTTMLWTFGYLATAVALYSTALALHKIKIENQNTPHLAVENDTVDLQNSGFMSMDNVYAKDNLFSVKPFINDFPHAPLHLETSYKESTQYISQNKNCYTSIDAFKSKVSVYKVEITKSVSPQITETKYNYFIIKEPLLNDSLSNGHLLNREWLDLRKNLCISVLMR